MEVEENFSDDSVCNRYLAQAAEVFDSDLMKGIRMCLEIFWLQPIISSWQYLYSNDHNLVYQQSCVL